MGLPNIPLLFKKQKNTKTMITFYEVAFMKLSLWSVQAYCFANGESFISVQHSLKFTPLETSISCGEQIFLNVYRAFIYLCLSKRGT